MSTGSPSESALACRSLNTTTSAHGSCSSSTVRAAARTAADRSMRSGVDTTMSSTAPASSRDNRLGTPSAKTSHNRSPVPS